MIGATTELLDALELSYRRIRAAYSGDLLMHDKCRKPLAYRGHLITVSGVMSPGRFGQEPLKGDGWLLTPRERWPHGTVGYRDLLDAWNQGTMKRGDQAGHLVRYRSRDLVLTRPILLTDHNWSWEREFGQYRDHSLELEYAAAKVDEIGRAQLSRQGDAAFIPLGYHELAEAAIQYATRLLDALEVRPGILAAGDGQRYQVMPREDLEAFARLRVPAVQPDTPASRRSEFDGDTGVINARDTGEPLWSDQRTRPIQSQTAEGYARTLGREDLIATVEQGYWKQTERNLVEAGYLDAQGRFSIQALDGMNPTERQRLFDQVDRWKEKVEALRCDPKADDPVVPYDTEHMIRVMDTWRAAECHQGSMLPHLTMA